MGRSHHVGFNFSSGLTSFVSQGCVPRPSGNGDIHYDKGLPCDFWQRQRTPGSYRLTNTPHYVWKVSQRRLCKQPRGGHVHRWQNQTGWQHFPPRQLAYYFCLRLCFVALTSIIRMRWVLPAYKLLRLNVLKTQPSRIVSLWWLIAPCGCLN